MQVHSFYRYHWVIQQKCKLLCMESSNTRQANLFRGAANVPFYTTFMTHDLKSAFVTVKLSDVYSKYPPQMNLNLKISTY